MDRSFQAPPSLSLHTLLSLVSHAPPPTHPRATPAPPQYELTRVTKAHHDVIRVYESKLTEFGIPVEELGFRPLLTNTGTGPAGLVVA